MPNVSVIVPTYNRVEYLRRLLDSIIQQTYSDYEVIIIDDCSPNIIEYHKLIAEYKNKIKNLIYIRSEKNYGTPTHARNLGMIIAKGSYIALCDDDDEWYSDKLKMQVDKFEENDTKCGLVYTWADTIDEESGEVLFRYRESIEGNCIKNLLKKDFIPTSSVMVRKDELLAVGGMDERMSYCCEDWDTWVRMLKNGTSCAVVKKVLLKYYRHPGECFSMKPQMYKGYIQFYKKNFLYALRVSPIAALMFVKHIASIYIKRRW